MIAHLEHFLTMWQEESLSTYQLIKQIDNQVIHKELIVGYRTIAQLICHMLETPKEMLSHCNLTIEGPEYDQKPLDTVEELLQMHEKVTLSVE